MPIEEYRSYVDILIKQQEEANEQMKKT